jgi:hypothetical protein
VTPSREQIESIIIEEISTFPALPRSMYWPRLQTRIKTKGWPKILDKMIEDGRIYITSRIVGGRMITLLNVRPEIVPSYPAHFNSPPRSIVDDDDDGNQVNVTYS